MTTNLFLNTFQITKWQKKDGLDGLDTDEHFKKMKVVNFDMIKNKVSQ